MLILLFIHAGLARMKLKTMRLAQPQHALAG
jgi:hypothetical protein